MSLLDMLELHATLFLSAFAEVHAMEAKWSHGTNQDGVVPCLAMVGASLSTLQVHLQMHGLLGSAARCARIMKKATAPMKYRDAVSELKVLRETMEDELLARKFLVLSSQEGALYEKPEVGWEFLEPFPSSKEDAIEGSRCFALARYTACVMHLARVVEVGLHALTEELPGIKLRHDWGGQLQEIEKELEKRYKSAGARTPDELFYSEAASQIGHMKNAWRNPSMHIDRRYNEELARDIMNAVKAFMRHLATRIHV